MPRVRRRLARQRREPVPAADLEALEERANEVSRERYRRMGIYPTTAHPEAPRMTDAVYARESAWREQYLRERLNAYRVDHGLEPLAYSPSKDPS
jgi:uncharacterized protein YkwD